ncbi:TetR/AcrR family transcriptional regulator [bacterium]|nr:TetR/AcrR family transcriptional regulator [bacterium]
MVKSITEIRREEITDAVLSLLARQGPKTLSAQTIAEAVGMAKASLYQHFSSVDEMVEAAIERIHSVSLDVLQQARVAADNPLAILRSFFHRIFHLPTIPGALISVARMDSESVPKWRMMMMEIENTLMPELVLIAEAAQAGGQIRGDIPARALLETVVALHHFQKLKHGYLNEYDENDFAQRFEHVWDLFIRFADKRAEF